MALSVQSTCHMYSPETDNGYTIGAPKDLMKYSWFHGRLSTREAEERLNLCSIDNSYLLCESNNHKGTLSLFTKHCDELHHFLIPHKPGGFEIEGTFKSFYSIPELVSHYQDKTNWVCERGICLGLPCPKPDSPSGIELYSNTNWSGNQFKGEYNLGAPLQLKQYEWFHGSVSREKAEERLKSWGTGCFLVRQSESYSHHGLLSLSVNVQGLGLPYTTAHLLIQSFPRGYNVKGSTCTKYFQSIPEMIAYYQKIEMHIRDVEMNKKVVLRLGQACSPKLIHEFNSLKRPLPLPPPPPLAGNESWKVNESDQKLSMGNKSKYEYLDEYSEVPGALSNCEWFHGQLTRRLAELRLRKCGATNCFLVYENGYKNNRHRGMLVLAIKNQEDFNHYLMLRSDDDYTITTGHLFPSVSELISYHQEHHIYIQSKSVYVHLGSQCCQY